jgi:hypothetical protein
MHHSEILQLFHRQPAAKLALAGIKGKLDLDRHADDPKYTTVEVLEEIDYLLIAGWLVGERHYPGYKLSDAWHRLDPDLQDEWRCHGTSHRPRPELDNPIDIPRPEGYTYSWEINNWYSFEFCVCRTADDDDEQNIALVSGLFRGSRPIVSQVKRVVTSALNQWYLTPAGAAAWENSMADFNVGDLAHCAQNYDLKQLLQTAGLRNLTIEDYFASDDWIYDNILGSLPNPVE